LPLYECNEHQFVENIRRLIEVKEKFLVNRKITWHDDAKFGPATLPEDEFRKYGAIITRRSLKSSVFAKIPFVDDFHGRVYYENENLHSSSSLLFPRLSIPYYKVEYTVNVWGGTYFFAFDALFSPEIVIAKRSTKKIGNGSLIHCLKYNPPKEKMLSINLPEDVLVFDVKNMIRVIDHSSNF
jgi:hypothetical protein